ncbi:NAD(P)H-dependent oxidoreductase [Variovorax terrae]|uniref:NAD(P)H-dependent oxidoreductase n=1 Tax=Variovorax terrae TaxID=2923278 RepID=A0A9X1VQS3_9BURK|nr:NAD(P)H-dependent oxidoreductase [Variovorax terrae]MCJ0761664.1 NAD(P)H-dependent oxidoreductase [Variovorax terrae]
MRTLVVHCHPNPESFNTALYRTAVQALQRAHHELRLLDLYAEGFDPVMTREERVAYLSNPGLLEARVQPHVDALRWAEHMVFVYPTWWYGPPAVLKGWFERVWLPGVTFRPALAKGQRAIPAMQHVRRLTVVTTSGSPWWWLRVMGDPGRRLFTRGLRSLFAARCKTTWLQLHDMNNVTERDCERFLAKVARTLEKLK